MLAALALGGALLTAALGGIGVATAVRAHVALDSAADAAALAARELTAAVTGELQVRYRTYACGPPGSSPAAGRRLRCAAGHPGSVAVPFTTGSFTNESEDGFGPDPGWASAAGCSGTIWAAPDRPGTWRICLGQTLEDVAVAVPTSAALQEVAQAWVDANLAEGSGVATARVTAISASADGEVTVTVQAAVDLPLLGSRVMSASAAAWPEG